jgi:hypothetical protein
MTLESFKYPAFTAYICAGCLCTIIATVKPDSARLVAKLMSLETMLAQGTQGTVQYPIDKAWIKDLNCYIQKNTRKFSEKISCNLFPRPITLSKTNDNDYVGEKTWNTLVELFGVSYQHDLSRQLSSSSDFNTYIMSAINIVQSPQDLENVGKFPIYWAFHKEEKLGYVMNQLRHHFKIPRERQTRLWFTPTYSSEYNPHRGHYFSFTATGAWLVTDLSQTVCMVRNSVRMQDVVKGIPHLLKRHDLTQRYPSPLYHEHEKPSCDPQGRGIATSLGQLTLEVATASHNSWPTNRYIDLVPSNPFPMPYRDRGYGLTFANSNSNTTDVDSGYNDETSGDIDNDERQRDRASQHQSRSVTMDRRLAEQDQRRGQGRDVDRVQRGSGGWQTAMRASGGAREVHGGAGEWSAHTPATHGRLESASAASSSARRR